nr:pantoate--beta-alanine ligase [uncultured Holophaga sp.]
MRIIRTIPELRTALKAVREKGKTIGFVPTMGYLHEGHASLIKQCVARCDCPVVSIFVNPTQFGPSEDFAQYPRDPERDQNLCLRNGVKILFMPEPSEVYPTGFSTFVDPGSMGSILCGEFRPGHFRGVATVVTKLFNMVQPDLAFFGQKDFQQVAIIQRLVKDLNLPVNIIAAPTIRESDGLAMSSRNTYLSPEERERALAISRGLLKAEQSFKEGARRVEPLVGLVRNELKGLDEIHYCELVDAITLEPVSYEISRSAVIAVAAMVGKTRLIDNVLLSPSGGTSHFISHQAD